MIPRLPKQTVRTLCLFIPLFTLSVVSILSVRSITQYASLDSVVLASRFSRNSQLPRLAWLMSYPNSGTSYTMYLVERLSNYSTASNYGVEVAQKFGVSPPVHSQHPEGPFWEGLSEQKGKTPRELPPTYVLTKTHCGGRCVDCGPSSYLLSTNEFLDECSRTTARVEGHNRRVVSTMDPKRVDRLAHLIRNPLHNIISRFHLSRRHILAKDPSMADVYPDSPMGFRKWCKVHDDGNTDEKRKYFGKLWNLMQKVPCHDELVKYTQWHNHARHIAPLMGNPPILTIYYEDYGDDLLLNRTAAKLLNFVDQPANLKLREFRELPDYREYFTAAQARNAQELVTQMATPTTRKLLARYL